MNHSRAAVVTRASAAASVAGSIAASVAASIVGRVAASVATSDASLVASSAAASVAASIVRRAAASVATWVAASVALLVAVTPPAVAAGLPSWYEPAALDSTRERLVATPGEDGKLPDVVRVLHDVELDLRNAAQTRTRVRRVVYLREGSGEDETAIRIAETYWRSIRAMRGWLVDAVGEVKVVDDRIETQLGGELYDESVLHTLWARTAGPGSTVLFESETVSGLADESAWLLYLPEDVPIGRWQCTVLHPKGTEITAAWLTDPLADPVAIPGDASRPGETRWVVDAIPDEAEVFVVHCTDPSGARWPLRSWEDVSLWFRELAITALRDAPDVLQRSRELVADLEDPEEKARRIAEFVQQSVAYVQVYLADGGWRPHHVEETLSNRFGDCKDMAHLVVAMLSGTGIEAYPALTNVDNELWERYPARGQFDHCIVAFRLPGSGSEWSFFDPTSRATPFGRLPASIEGEDALISGITPPIGLLALPRSRPEENERRYLTSIRLDERGEVRAEVVEKRTGHAAFGLREYLRDLSESKRKEWLVERLESRKLGGEVLSLSISGFDAPLDTLVLTYELALPSWAKRAGARVLLQPDLVSARIATFVADDDEEPEFSYPFVTRSRVDVEIPVGWEVESLPEPVEEISEFAAYTRRIELVDGTLRLERTERLTAVRPRDAGLEAVRRWDAAAYRTDRTQVVLRVP